jgi:hypothetical protein
VDLTILNPPVELNMVPFSDVNIIGLAPIDWTLSERLTLAAGKSPLWDRVKGRPRSGHENKFVKEIANQAMIYPELKEMFARHGYEIEVSAVEKVFIDPQTKLPYDCLTWFSLSKL